MPSGVTFWRCPDEEENFLSFIENSGEVLAIPVEKMRDKNRLILKPLREVLAAQNPTSVYLILGPHTEKLKVHQFQDQTGPFYTISALDSPILQYARGSYRAEGRLGQSNLSGVWSRVDPESGKPVDKPEEFIRWGKSALNWIRRNTLIAADIKGEKRVSERVLHLLGGNLLLVP